MKTIITNKIITVEAPTDKFVGFINQSLTYTDTSKQFQIRKMEKNPYYRNSFVVEQLKKESVGSLLTRYPNGNISFPSGFAYLLDSFDMEIDDRRHFTGEKLVFPWKEKPFDLRPYQQEAVDQWKNSYNGLVNLATGLGKTLVAIHAIREIGRKTLIICPGKSIANQFYDQLCLAFGRDRVGYLGSGKKTIKDITVGIIGTINNNLELLQKQNFGVVLCDEVHHIAAATFYKAINALGDVGQKFGLTATDFRSDGKDIMLTAGVGSVCIRRDAAWGVKNKYLAEPFIFIREVVSGAKEISGDKLKNYRNHVLNNKHTLSIIENDCKQVLATGKSLLCLVSEVAHGEILSKELGIPFATGEDKQSLMYVDQLNKGEIPGLIGTSSFIGEGTDTKAVDFLVIANFVASKGPVLQCLGRGLRKTATKDKVIVFDYKIVDSPMFSRHCATRIKVYKEITSNIKIVK